MISETPRTGRRCDYASSPFLSMSCAALQIPSLEQRTFETVPGSEPASELRTAEIAIP